jgi:branched-chain amino acid transport system substrate-binding protein
MKKAVFFITAVMLSLVFWSCQEKRDVVRIGAILPLTGERASVGASAKNGIDLAIEEINANDFLGGKKLSLQIEDSQGMPTISLSCFERLATVSTIPAIIGPLNSSEVLSIAPKAEQKKIVVMTPAASSPLITEAGDYIFRNVASDLYEATLMADAVIDNFKKNRVAIAYINNDYGKGIYGKFSKGLENKKQNLVAVESYEGNQKDFRTIILKLKEAKPDAIYLVGYKEIAYFIKQLKEQGVNSLLLTTAIFEDHEIIDIAGNSAEGIIFTTFYLEENSENKRTRDFFQNYEKKYNLKPDGYAATSYDAVYLIAQAIKNKGATSDSIKNGLYEIQDFPGLLGNFSIDKNGDVTLPIKMKTVKGGQLVNFNFSELNNNGK